MKYPLNADDYHMSSQEVADRLGWTKSTVESLHHQGMVKMRNYCRHHNIKFTDLIDSLSVTRRGR